MVRGCLFLLENIKLSPAVAALFCVPTSDVREILLPLVLSSTWCCQCFWILTILIGV